MKRILFPVVSIILCVVVFPRCSMNDDHANSRRTEKTNFPAHIEEYGIALAKEFRQTVYNLNEMGIFYTDADNSPEFRERFYNDWYNASPAVARSGVSRNDMQISPEVFRDRYRNLTEIQIGFINRIIDETHNSTSYDDFCSKLININKDIYALVPEIEQERIFKVTAILYYGIKEVQYLENSGLLPVVTHNNYSPLLKTRSEPGEGIGGSCRKFLATTWVIAIGEPTPAGEIVAGIATIVVGGILLYEVITCSKSESGAGNLNWYYCQDKFANCVPKFGYQDPCSRCLEYCLSNGSWPGISMGCL